MAAVAFDTLKFARRLMQAGMPEALAEAQAELMAEAFLFNLDSLVTRDYLEARLDAKFAEFEARLDKKIDARFGTTESHFAGIESSFASIESRFIGIESSFASIESRFIGIESSFASIESRFIGIESCFAKIEARISEIESRLAENDVRFAEIDGKFRLMFWMQGIIIAATVLPAVHALLNT